MVLELWVVAGRDLDGCQDALSEKSLGNESLAHSLQEETHRTHFFFLAYRFIGEISH